MTKARTNADNASADIQGVTAGTGLSGGGTSGTVTLTNDMATTIAAKGDLVVGTGNDTYAALTVGSNGDTLVADSSATTGLRYNPPVGSLANPVINGGMDIWQRGTSQAVTSSSTSFHGADRWQIFRAATGSTVSRQTVSDTTNLPNIQFSMRLQRDSGNTSTAAISAQQNFETVNSIPFVGRTVTLSFYARAGANYSASSSLLLANLVSGTGTDQNLQSAYTGLAYPINTNVTLTTTWQRFALTGTIASTATEIATQFVFTPTGTAGANDWVEITGVQIDVGTWTASTAPAFRRSGGTLAGELAACRRYLPCLDGNNSDQIMGYAYASNAVVYGVQFDVPARVAPTGITPSGTITGFGLNTQYSITPTYNASSVNGCSILGTSGVTITAGQGSRLYMASGSKILFTGCEL